MPQRFLRFRAWALTALLAAWMAVAAPHPALAWGATGHRIIGRLAVESLPADLPAFLRTPAVAEAIGELAREPDRWKDAGRVHDADRDPGHFLDLGDDGRVLGGPALTALPATREGYDSDLRAVGADSWRAGYLPYSIIDGWQQLSKDFAYWRVERAAIANLPEGAHRTWIAGDAVRREELILRDLGVLAHYVGDGSQPLHVTSHFNGWGPGPNPEDFTQDRLHAMFEGALVRRYVDEAAVRADMTPYHDCHCQISQRTAAFLAATSAQVAPLYRLQKLGAFAGADARGRTFTAHRLAAGAVELRDMVVDAWRASASGEVGYPAVRVADVAAGRIDPYDSLYGLD
jgi:hypothetical protein